MLNVFLKYGPKIIQIQQTKLLIDINTKKENPFKKYLDVFTVSTAKNRECGKKWIYEKQADYYLSSTFYKENKVVKKFEDVKYGSGIAIKINTTNIKEKKQNS
ncbi:hypothetical protein [Mycoplasmopsis felis]|uniref:Uncharacterized protein n=1 Tax=Mycoplasmopsis felis TaxID=33923 RepID=A0A809SII8_9BACT|nr:hypothetical protein [Mycoplasmopsis felis]BBU47953.1 hypothetical protein JPM2_6460 [Mycoplasmopsis felis]